MKRANLVIALALASACGGGGDGPADSELLGIYAIDAWTRNTAACTEGPSILADQPETMFVLDAGEFFGQGYLGASLCADQADCEAAALDDALDLTGWLFEAGSDSAGWTGRVTVAFGAGPGEDGCAGEVTDHTLTATGAGTVRLESRMRPAAWTGRDADGFCDTDRAQAEAEGQPCAELEVVTATRTAEL